MCDSIYGTDNVLTMILHMSIHANILSVMTCPQLIKMSYLCLHWMGKEACMARPAGGAVEIDWQLLSPVTTYKDDYGEVTACTPCPNGTTTWDTAAESVMSAPVSSNST